MRTIAAWRALLFHADVDPYRGERSAGGGGGPVIASARWSALPVAEVEKRIDELLLSHAAAESSEGHRKRRRRWRRSGGCRPGC